jgi:hypothetical protein
VRRAARVRAQRRVHCSAVLCRQTHERERNVERALY